MALLLCVLVLAALSQTSSQTLDCPGTDPHEDAPDYVKTVIEERYSRKEERIQYVPLAGEDPGEPLFLTPYIKDGKVKEAQFLARVIPDIGGMPSYSGFLTINEECGSNLFFWYFPAQESSESAPLVTWLQGGPGMSSMFGLFTEVGPFNHFPEGLKNREFSWNVKNNLVFFDQPVGTGFSFTSKGCFAPNEITVGIDMYNALVQFLTLFPKLQKNRFVLTGDSYAGHYIPAIAYTIHINNPSANLKINLYGMMIGDGWIDPETQIGYAEYLYQTGLIGNRVKNEMEKYQKCFTQYIQKQDWLSAERALSAIYDIIRANAGVSMYNYLPNIHDRSNWEYFLTSTSSRKAIHVGPLQFAVLSDEVYYHLKEDRMRSVKPWVEELLEHYPIMFYAGQVDVICAYPMMVNFLRSLKWSGQSSYLDASRHQWRDEYGEVAGYVKGLGGLSDVMVRGAGHSVPTDQPHWAYHLVNSFTGGNLFSLLAFDKE